MRAEWGPPQFVFTFIWNKCIYTKSTKCPFRCTYRHIEKTSAVDRFDDDRGRKGEYTGSRSAILIKSQFGETNPGKRYRKWTETINRGSVT